MRITMISLFLLLVCLAKAQEVMNLKACIEEGLRNNPDLQVSGIDVEMAGIDIKGQKSRRMPVVAGVFQVSDYIDRPASVTSGSLLGADFPNNPTWQAIRTMRYTAGAAIQMNIPLLDLTIKAETDIARMSADIQRTSLEKKREDLIVQIANVYYLAQATQKQMELTESNLLRMDELVKIAKARYEEGLALETDFTRSEVNRKQLETLKDAYASALKQQKNLMRYLLNTGRELEFAPMPSHLETSYKGSLCINLPELRIVEQQKELVTRQITSVRKAYWPTIALQGQLGAVGYQEKFGHFFHTEEATQNWFGNTFLGLSIRIPIFDARNKKLKIRKMKMSLNQLEWKHKQTLNGLNKEYADVIAILSHNLKAFQTHQEACRQADDIYRQATERYAEGLASMTELLQDEMALRTSQTGRVQAMYDYRSAELRALKLSGDLDKLYKR